MILSCIITLYLAVLWLIVKVLLLDQRIAHRRYMSDERITITIDRTRMRVTLARGPLRLVYEFKHAAIECALQNALAFHAWLDAWADRPLLGEPAFSFAVDLFEARHHRHATLIEGDELQFVVHASGRIQ